MAIKKLTCCDLCGATEDIIIPEVGISFSMSGNDFAFCKPCLEKQSALEFWKTIVEMHDYKWPLARK